MTQDYLLLHAEWKGHRFFCGKFSSVANCIDAVRDAIVMSSEPPFGVTYTIKDSKFNVVLTLTVGN